MDSTAVQRGIIGGNSAVNSSTRPQALSWQTAVIAGLLIALIYTASPLFTVALVGSVMVLGLAARGLPPDERRWLTAVLGTALLLRLLFIGAVLAGGIPWLNDLSIGALRGDEAYYLGRAIRARDIALDLPVGKYDYFVVTDEYGRTNYVQFLTVLQILLGPTPYGMRAVNALIFISGAAILFRLIRPWFGAAASFAALTVLLFLPSLFVASASMLRESIYFFASVVLLFAATRIWSRPRPAAIAAALALGTAALLLLDGLRRGALVLAIAGVTFGVAAPIVFATRRRAAATVAGGMLALAVAWLQPATHARMIEGITSVAKTHAGHVFTSGHAYKLLDEGFYYLPAAPAAWPLQLEDDQALRFLVRAAASFLVTPLPWEMATRSELIFFPEHAVWLLMVAFAPIGVVAGWRRNPRLTALLVGFILPTAAALAVTNGNVGTLLRLRGLVTPYLVWIGVLGVLSVAEYLLTPRPARHLTSEHAR
jgi:hypothetical protein